MLDEASCMCFEPHWDLNLEGLASLFEVCEAQDFINVFIAEYHCWLLVRLELSTLWRDLVYTWRDLVSTLRCSERLCGSLLHVRVLHL